MSEQREGLVKIVPVPPEVDEQIDDMIQKFIDDPFGEMFASPPEKVGTVDMIPYWIIKPPTKG